jgi:YVTN family beta-propeller protein
MLGRPLMAAMMSAALALAAASAPVLAAPDYKVTKTVPLGAPDHWDYVVYDPASHRVFVAHGDQLSVVDGSSGTVLGAVTGLSTATHGIGISTANGRGYTDDSEAGTASAFDLATLKPVKTIKAGSDADAIAVDPVSGHVIVINGDSGTVTVIDPKTDAALATVELGGKLEYAVADGAGSVFINGAGKREIIRFDMATNTAAARYPVPDCESPHGLAIDRATKRLFSSCVNGVLMVVDAGTGRIVAKLPIGQGTDAAAFDPKRKLVFSSNGKDGTLSIIEERDADSFVPVATIKTAVSARTMDIDPETGRLYLVAADLESPAVGRPHAVPGSLRLLFLDPMP